MTIRLEISPGDHFDIAVKPFHTLTVEEHIRMYEQDDVDSGAGEMERAKNRIMRITGAPSRFVRYMTPNDVDKVLMAIEEQTNEHDRIHGALAKVNETLSKWADEHDGAEFKVEDAKQVMLDHGLFRDRFEVEGQEYTAPLVERAIHGKWIDLQGAMIAANESKDPESMSYVRALAIMMDGPDGEYPSQRQDESDAAHETRLREYIEARQRLFLHAPFVDVMGCAAFFFSKSHRFAALCAHNMRRFQSLLPPRTRPVLEIIPRDGNFLRSLM